VPPPAAPAPGGYSQYGGPQYAQPQAGSDVSNAFQYGWTKFQQNFGQIIIAVAVWFVLLIVLQVVSWMVQSAIYGANEDCTTTSFGVRYCTNDTSWWTVMLVSGVFGLAFFIAQYVGSYAVIRGALAITGGQPLNTAAMFNMDHFVPFLITGIVVSLITFVGMLLCFLPGIVAWFFLFMAPYYAADKGMGVGEALRASVTTMNRNLARMITFFIGSFIAYLVGALLCGVGLLVAMPVVVIASAYMYKTANGEPIAA